MSPRIVIWTLVISVILSFGWYKAAENERDRRLSTDWTTRIRQLEAESLIESDRIAARLRDLPAQADAKRQLEEEFNSGEPFHLRPEGQYQAAQWTHPEYGLDVTMTFHGDKLIAHGISAGTGHVIAVNPEPPQVAMTSRAEAVRQFVAGWGVSLWLGALFVAILVQRFGLVATEVLLALALAYGTAQAVSPLYSLSIRGIFSNDALFFAAIMLYFASALCLAFQLVQRGYRPRLRFSLRSALAGTTVVALLLAIGTFGHVVLGVLAVGGLIFYGWWRVLATARFTAPGRRTASHLRGET